MGCGKSKSKQDVATGNTIVTAPKNSFKNNVEESNKSPEEALPGKSTIVAEECIENVKQDEGQKPDKVALIPENIETMDNQEQGLIESGEVIDRVDDVLTNTAAVVEEEEQEMVESSDRLICRDSPNTFFSSRKDDEAVGSIVSVYESPRDEKESQTNVESATADNDNAIKEDGTVEIVALETPVVVVDEEKDAIVAEEVIESCQSKN